MAKVIVMIVRCTLRDFRDSPGTNNDENSKISGVCQKNKLETQQADCATTYRVLPVCIPACWVASWTAAAAGPGDRKAKLLS